MAASLPDPARRRVAVAILCCLAAGVAAAATPTLPRPTKEPIDLVAASSDFDYKQNRLHFEQVRITQGPMQVEAREASATRTQFRELGVDVHRRRAPHSARRQAHGVERRGDVPRQGNRERRDPRIAGGVRTEAQGHRAGCQGSQRHDRLRLQAGHRAPHRRRLAHRRRERDPGRHAGLRRKPAARRGQPRRDRAGRRADHDQSEGPGRQGRQGREGRTKTTRGQGGGAADGQQETKPEAPQ